jgi:hypothetical protein
MPLVKLHVPATLPADRCHALADAVHAGLVATCRVPPADRFQIIQPHPATSLLIDPHFPDVHRSHEACIVEILFLTGRTVQQKARLFRHIAAGANAAGFRGDDIMIALTENEMTDWSLGNGRGFGENHHPLV